MGAQAQPETKRYMYNPMGLTVSRDGASMIMDWNKVIANLREQTNYYTKRAHEAETQSVHHELVKQYRASADVASILASAFTAGMQSGDRTAGQIGKR